VSDVVLAVQQLSASRSRRLLVQSVSFELRQGQVLGVVGANGSGKTTLLRTLVGFVRPSAGEVRICGRLPPGALRESPTAYFAGETTLPGFVRASAWGSLGTGEVVMTEARPIRALSRSTRQRLGLRTALGRHPLHLIVLDDPWDGLDPDASRWLSSTLETKRDRGAAVVLSSPRLSDLAGICDKYLFLASTTPMLVRAHEISRSGTVTPQQLLDAFDRCRDHPTTAIALTGGPVRPPVDDDG
jgi:ABC-2 type transport system ATP-binding protein